MNNRLRHAIEQVSRRVNGVEVDAAIQDERAVNLMSTQVMALVRHGKVSRLKDALAPIAKKKFDPAIVKVPYVEDFGTAYVDAYERETFNLNKVNEHGNTMLHVAAQNGNVKIAKLLVEKGANPNHQNKGGQTAGHFASDGHHLAAFYVGFLSQGSSTRTAAAPTTRSRTCTGSGRTTGSRWSSKNG